MNQKDSVNLDVKLMSNAIGYSLDQLMELAGQGIALCINDLLLAKTADSKEKSILFLIGPGNNGGDGLVAARFLKLFYPNLKILVYLIEESKVMAKFPNLLSLLAAFQIEYCSSKSSLQRDKWDYIIDCIFGFSFKSPLRGIYIEMIDWLAKGKDHFLVSVDIPSGWDVETGPLDSQNSLQPNAIISLTAPKLCIKRSGYKGIHYVTGRFIPPSLYSEIADLPVYLGSSLFTRLY